jgi:uncharacterized Zn-binding protein involved in type VI secretion
VSKPAARIGDMHVCPLVTPGVPPIPHVGGPILTSSAPQILIEGQPAACVGDTLLCVGPPDAIVSGAYTVLGGGKPLARVGDQTAHGGVLTQGSPTVMIGESGAADSAPAAGKSVLLVSRDDPSWIAIELRDQDGKGVAAEEFRVTLPDGRIVEGSLDKFGKARIEGIPHGSCAISFPALDEEAWDGE